MTTQERIEALEEALGTGVLEVTIDGQRVRYASTSDLVKALNYFKNKLAIEAGSSGGGVVKFAQGTFSRD